MELRADKIKTTQSLPHFARLTHFGQEQRGVLQEPDPKLT